MSAESLIKWPAALVISNTIQQYGEATNGQKQCNAAGEEYGFLMNFDGSAIESISIPLAAGTDATTVALEIQGIDNTADTINVSGMPDGTAITNGTASVSSKGGTAEWVTWTFGTAPTPSGQHWVVVKPSGGAFNLLFPYSVDWTSNKIVDQFYGFEKLYTTAWSGTTTLGPSPMRVKKTSGQYLINHAHPALSTTGGETANSRSSTGTNCVGVKFVAPFDMVMNGIAFAFNLDAYHYVEIVLVDSSDSELGRGALSYSISSFYGALVGLGSVQLTGGNTYRAYLTGPSGVAQTSTIQTQTISSGGYDVLNLASGDWEYTTASDPPAEGGVGTWTDTATEIPIAYIMGYQNPNDLAGGGGGGQTSHTFAV
tara:strand:- start:3570 stop:4679 length:1110 start_codon:yes stop_codon:yes gene_type:complete